VERLSPCLRAGPFLPIAGALVSPSEIRPVRKACHSVPCRIALELRRPQQNDENFIPLLSSASTKIGAPSRHDNAGAALDPGSCKANSATPPLYEDWTDRPEGNAYFDEPQRGRIQVAAPVQPVRSVPLHPPASLRTPDSTMFSAKAATMRQDSLKTPVWRK
jgi:hypothetical protein